MTPEKELWSAVLQQAVVDLEELLSFPMINNPVWISEGEKLYSWFTAEDDSVIGSCAWICHMLDVRHENLLRVSGVMLNKLKGGLLYGNRICRSG